MFCKVVLSSVSKPNPALAQLLETAVVSDVRPVLECIERRGEGYLARFGYLNEEGRAVTIPTTSNNTFTPSPADRGQPTTFELGRQRNVFEVAFGGDELVWTLGQRTAMASANPTQRCE